jgi:hypothetical protein
MTAPSETPLEKSQRLARELTDDPVAASMIRKHVAPVRLIDLLELTEEDFYFAFPALTEPSDGD